MLGRANIGLAWATSPGGGEERQELVLVWVLASSQGEGPGDGPGVGPGDGPGVGGTVGPGDGAGDGVGDGCGGGADAVADALSELAQNNGGIQVCNMTIFWNTVD